MIKSNNNFNLHPLMKNIKGNKILDYRFRTRIDEKYIPQYFNNKIVFQSYDSFQQNNLKLSKMIRRYVKQNIKTQIIQAIGGEGYLYSEESICYTNSESIYNDMKYNCYNNSKLVNYNKYIFNFTYDDIVLNLSNLNKELMIQINKCNSNRIIIINCHHEDFWKKTKLLNNFKLITRRKFIDYKSKYFLTVNIFVRKSFISLGGNCSVTYQLNKYNLRSKSFPYDWSKIKINKLRESLKYNFLKYDDIDIYKYSKNHNSWLLKNNYAIFAHEYMIKYSIEEFKEKINKRIKNLKEIKNPIFIRLETYSYKNEKKYKEYWEEIIKELDRIYDKYKIILISKINPKEEKIKWYKYEEFNEEWENNNIEWIKIFKENKIEIKKN